MDTQHHPGRTWAKTRPEYMQINGYCKYPVYRKDWMKKRVRGKIGCKKTGRWTKGKPHPGKLGAWGQKEPHMQNSPAASRGGSGSHGVRLPINIHSSSNCSCSGGGGRGSGGRWGRVWLSEGWGESGCHAKQLAKRWPTVAPRVPDTDAGSPTHIHTKPRDRRRHTDQTKTNTCKCKANKRQIQER